MIMGMESFFIIILPEGIKHFKNEYGNNDYIGESNVTHDELKEFFSHINGISYFDIDELSCHVSNKFLIKSFFRNNKLVYLCMEACLWYLENNINDIIDILNIFINKNFHPFHPGINSIYNTINEFVENLKEFYHLKTNNFIARYSTFFLNENILPGNFFYRRIGICS